MENKIINEVCAEALRLGAYKAKVINAGDIVLDRVFRDMCERNACGMYGRCHTCPPDAGDIDVLMDKVRDYSYALVFQTVTELEDSFDFEGMIDAKKSLVKVSCGMRSFFEKLGILSALHLSAGGCGICETCAKVTDEPCRHPSLALPSLEAYGVNVSKLAAVSDMKYINGHNTVTYFGAVLFNTEDYVQVKVNGVVVKALKGTVLSQVINGEKPCGGHGKCGKCKVTAKGGLSAPTAQELSMLSVEELSRGVRLACLTKVTGDCVVETDTVKKAEQVVTRGDLPSLEINPVFEKYGVAIDVGTTTLAGRLYDRDGKLLSTASSINPQQKWGADVVSRIEASLAGRGAELAGSIRKAIGELITVLANEAAIDEKDTDAVVITGNTVMLSLLTEDDTEPFSHAPFDVKRLFGETLTAKKLGLSSLEDDTPVYLPPCISAFVGADITCAILATQLCDRDVAMLVDIGTNGEMALWTDGKLSVCSTAAGPAFEGVGISAGMRGATGAIDKVTLKDGRVSAHVIGDVSPVGICGSGIIDAVAVMLETEAVDETGYLEDEEFAVADGVTVSQDDVRMIQLSKSAVCAGLMTLTESAGLTCEDIPVLYVAGGFGNYLNMKSSAEIGLLPKTLAERSSVVGNAAIAGASMLLLDAASRERICEIAKNAETVELSTSKVFSDFYISGMMFEEV